MVLPRSDSPVEERFFFLASKSLAPGRPPLGADVGVLDMVRSAGDPGDGGVLDRVVTADLVMEKRRWCLLGGGPPLMTVPFDFLGVSWIALCGRSVRPSVGACARDGGLGVPSICGTGSEVCEPRRKRLDMVRLKLLEVLPRVERREREP